MWNNSLDENKKVFNAEIHLSLILNDIEYILNKEKKENLLNKILEKNSIQKEDFLVNEKKEKKII